MLNFFVEPITIFIYYNKGNLTFKWSIVRFTLTLALDNNILNAAIFLEAFFLVKGLISDVSFSFG